MRVIGLSNFLFTLYWVRADAESATAWRYRP